MQILYNHFSHVAASPVSHAVTGTIILSPREGGRPQMQFFEPVFQNIFPKSDLNPRTRTYAHTCCQPATCGRRGYDDDEYGVIILVCNKLLLPLSYEFHEVAALLLKFVNIS